MKTLKLLGVRIDSVPRKDLEGIFTEMLNGRKFQHIATVNPEFLVAAHRDPVFRKILNKTDLNLCDGAGISLMAKLLYGRKIHRTTGVDVAEILCRTAAKQGKSVYFLGGFGVAHLAAVRMQKKFPNLRVAGAEDGDPEACSKLLKSANPDVILVAFGAPKQEFWLNEFGDQIPGLKLGGGFGGTFDFWAGKLRRAPGFFQKIGLEWCWRLGQEPRKRAPRIWRAVCVFPFLAIRERFEKKEN
ncbi:MAG: WecB/TagA/CpsF family glycosyltransferase [Candidatus Gracilibacteria bacterium]|nr:WecB/TagA/CpsF family glycosyltransferase [Candidatus Gracilibacteria bacterium]